VTKISPLRYEEQKCWDCPCNSKISNLCDPDPLTLLTDRQTDDMRSHSALRGKTRKLSYRKDDRATIRDALYI